MARRDQYDDDRVVVIERDQRGSIGMLLLGLAIGAGAAMLFAPASGEETRARLQREARRAGRRVREMADDLGTDVADRVERTRTRLDRGVRSAREAVDSRLHAVGEAVEAGREAAASAREELERAVAETKRVYAESRRAYRSAMAERDASADAAPDVAADDTRADDAPAAG
jgi:gas vesicle protein